MNRDTKVAVAWYRLSMADVHVALFFLFFGQVRFFGTGK